MRIVLAGGSGGIGAAMLAATVQRMPDATVFATWHQTEPRFQHPAVNWHQVDLASETSVAKFAETTGPVSRVINAAGVLHTSTHQPEKTLRHFDPEFFLYNMRVNALPTLLLAKHFNGRFDKSQPAVFATVSARVGSIEDNRLGGWSSYRCSKAALNMAIKNISIEWSRTAKNVTVAALHPGTTDTPLSQPFQSSVKPEKLFSAEKTAGLLLDVIDTLTPEHTGRFYAYDGVEIPW
jgi:NAD(P)-dependent dehydrogenase (short-subunit alcohol dehydrogenase family)